MDIPQHIFFMTKAKEWLERLNETNQDTEYQFILHDINEYLKKNCKHSVIKDYIDIIPDHNQCIDYCEYCNMTFH